VIERFPVIGGLFATLLTLLFLPALYVARLGVPAVAK